LILYRASIWQDQFARSLQSSAVFASFKKVREPSLLVKYTDTSF
jgi:hypothetical protein